MTLPAENAPVNDGHRAVAEALAQIMERRYPGTSWIAVRPGAPAPGPNQIVRRLASPEYVDAIRQRVSGGRRAA